jgi:hypothetical protein
MKRKYIKPVLEIVKPDLKLPLFVGSADQSPFAETKGHQNSVNTSSDTDFWGNGEADGE